MKTGKRTASFLVHTMTAAAFVLAVPLLAEEASNDRNGAEGTGRTESLCENPAFVSGEGRLEATEIDLAVIIPGKIEEIKVDEGDYVKAGQALVRMQTNALEAELEQANAQIDVRIAELEQANAEVQIEEAKLDSAKAELKSEQAELDQATAGLIAEEAELVSVEAEFASRKVLVERARNEYERARTLMEKDVISKREFEAREAEFKKAEEYYEAAESALRKTKSGMESGTAAVRKAESNLESGKAAVRKAEAALAKAKAAVKKAEASIQKAKADAARIQADIDDSALAAPREGRVLSRIASEGQVLGAGAGVLTLVDLTDVYLTFFVPEDAAGRISIGADARILLDAKPGIAIPAKVSCVASVAPFTPKSVETKKEREKLMFRVKAQIDPDFIKQYVEYVKTGIPGAAWVRLDDKEPWPDFLLTTGEK